MQYLHFFRHFTVCFFFLLLAHTSWASEEERKVSIFEEMQQTIIDVSEKVKPSVVHIEAFIRTQQRSRKSLGSGVVADANGSIITNHHVVFRAEKINVVFPSSSKRYEAKILTSDPLTDIAILKIVPDQELTAPKFANSDTVKVGEWVLAIGNPFGLDGTVSFGIVSAKSRNLNVSQINEFIQTDAMIDPGSSGGPLVNLQGEVIGINSMIQGRGIGFTIPINTALKIKDSISDEGDFERGWLGVSMSPFSHEMTEYFGMEHENGIFVKKVLSDTPASSAGIQVGDVIVEYNNKTVGADYDQEIKIFQRQITATKVGSEVPIKIVREGETKILTVKIGRYPKMSSQETETKYGFNIMEITSHLYNNHRLETKEGVYVSFVAPDSKASEAKLREGDIIFWVEGAPVKTVTEFLQAIKKLDDKKKFLVKTYRQNKLNLHLFKLNGTKPEGHPH